MLEGGGGPDFFLNSKNYLPYQSSIPIQISTLARKQIHSDIQGVLGGSPRQKPEIFLEKKIKQMKAFPFR